MSARRIVWLLPSVALIALGFQNCGTGFRAFDGEAQHSSTDGSNPPPTTPTTPSSPPPSTPSSPPSKGFLSTSGNQIVDKTGKPVRMVAVNWQGFEQGGFAPAGLYAQNWKQLMDGVKARGFNLIRLPFSLEMLSTTKSPGNIDFTKNPDLVGKKPMEILDMVVAYAGQIGLRVILDCHRRLADINYQGTEVDGLWYNATYTEAAWIAAWVQLATRYKGNEAVIGADLWNEPHSYRVGAIQNTVTWGGGGANDWARAAESAAGAILTANPDWLIIVAGISGYKGIAGAPDNDVEWWGANLQGARARPIVPKVNGVSVTNKVVYSPHVYPRGIVGTNSPLMTAATYPGNMAAVWTATWGYLYTENRAPVWIGEVAANVDGGVNNAKCSFNDPTEPMWFNNFVKYMNGDFDLNGASDLAAGKQPMSWAYWTYGFDDCGRYLFTDVLFSTVDLNKINRLQGSFAPLF